MPDKQPQSPVMGEAIETAQSGVPDRTAERRTRHGAGRVRRLAGRVRRMARRIDAVALALIVAAVFVWITDKPVHALFLGSVGLALAWATFRQRSPAELAPQTEATVEKTSYEPSAGTTCALNANTPGPPNDLEPPAYPAPSSTLSASSGHGVAVAIDLDGDSEALHRRRAYHGALLAGAGVVFCLVTAAFPRFSWPATIAVVTAATLILTRTWERSGDAPNPREDHAIAKPNEPYSCEEMQSYEEPHPSEELHPSDERHSSDARYSRAGLVAWIVFLCAGALWELAALLMQPSLREGSYDHPTISVIMDDFLAAYWGRVIILLLWLALGWFLVRQTEP